MSDTWADVLDHLEALAEAGGSIEAPSLDHLPALPDEMAGRARAVLARLREATEEVDRRMGEVRAEMAAARRGPASRPAHTLLDVDA